MNDAEFDRALGAWEDNQLNAHLAKEEEWEDAIEKAVDTVWDMKRSELYEMAPVGVDRTIEEVVNGMYEHVAQLIMDGGE